MCGVDVALSEYAIPKGIENMLEIIMKECKELLLLLPSLQRTSHIM